MVTLNDVIRYVGLISVARRKSMDEETIKEIRNPDKSALVVWDVQKILVERIFNREEFLGNLNRLIEAARKTNVPVFFTKITPPKTIFKGRLR